MLEKMTEIKSNVKNGRIRLQDMCWLFDEIDRLQDENKSLKESNRFKKFMKISEENLILEESLKQVRQQRDFYKKKCSEERFLKQAQ